MSDPACEVPVCRPSVWGNPYTHKDGMLAEHRVASVRDAIAAYRRHVLSSPELLGRLDALAGRTLGCFCKTRSRPTAPCHGDVLADLSDRRRVAIIAAGGAPLELVSRALNVVQGPLLVVCPGGGEGPGLCRRVAEGAGCAVAHDIDTAGLFACRPHQAVGVGDLDADQLEALRRLYRAGVPVTLIGADGTQLRHAPAGR